MTNLVLSTKCETFDFLVHFFVILLVTFYTENLVESGQNRSKLIKMQFLYVLITFLALELVTPAQMKKNVLHRFSDCLVGKH